jgi:glycosyltransferase involved in cell wall biosynthesis
VDEEFMKILIFTTAYFPMVGGAEVAIKEITDRIRDVEFHLFCAKMRPDTPRKEKVGNVMVHRIGIGKPFDKYLLPILGPFAALRATRDKDRDPHVTRLRSFLRMTRDKRSVTWSVMASYGGFAALFFSWMKPKLDFVLTLQEGDPVERYEKRSGVLNGLRKRIFKRATRVHAISRFLASWAKDMGASVEPVVIPNGVEIALFSKPIGPASRERLRMSFGYAPDDVVLVTASRLSHKNAVDDVIRALPELPDRYKFLVLGSGEDENMLRELCDRLGLHARVHFLGSIDNRDLPPLLQASDIFIRPSRSEGLGIAFLEAMAAGLPIIATPVGGIPDFLLDGETGIFCLPDDPNSIVAAVRRLDDAAMRNKVVEQARKVVTQKYDWDIVAKQMETLLKRV